MDVVDRKTKWGRMLIVRQEGSEDPLVEVMEFLSPGKFHTHETTEFVRCLAGEGRVEMLRGRRADEMDRRDLAAGGVVVTAGTPHRMVPTSDALVCLVTYGGL